MWIGVVCFPFVMLVSWVYEFTPEGLKRERDIDRDASITHLTARRLDYLIIAMLAVAMGLFALWLSYRRRLALATLLVFTVSALTFAKTVLILLIEVVTGLEHVGHNPLADLVLLYLLPNGVWVVMPAVVAWLTGRRLLAGFR